MRGVLTRFGGLCVLAGVFGACGGVATLGHGNGGLDGGNSGGTSGTGNDAGTPGGASGVGGDSGASGSAGAGGDSGSGVGGTSGAGPGGTSGSGGSGAGGYGGTIGGPQRTSDKLDVLLLVDNSRSMASQQQAFAQSAQDLVTQLTALSDDIHFGVISSSLGGHGADTCSPASGASFDPSQNDRAHLIATVRDGVASYNNKGFLKWDPNALGVPAGQNNGEALTQDLRNQILAAGEIGCGFEAQLEAVYRFLVDPAPPLDVVQQNGEAVLQNTDTVLLQQRAAFLRPDSSVLVVILSDEDDCSIFDGGIAWLAGQGTGQGGSQFVLPKATTACATNPNSPCCRSCNTIESNGPPAGCMPTQADPACQNPYHNEQSDALNLRCWEQKRRFGLDFTYSVSRYVEAFSESTIHDRQGAIIANPLFSAGRHPTMISVASLVGVPWQDLAKNPADAQNLDFMSPAELRSNGRWEMIVGDPVAYVPPTDPFMRASVTPRSGQNPITGQPISPDTATTLNPINGHEYINQGNDLQFACIYPLQAPVECGNVGGCACFASSGHTNSPVCNGTIQTHAKAYPGIRHLDFMQQLGDRAAVSSICPRNVTDAARSDFGYRPAIRAIVQRVSQTVR